MKRVGGLFRWLAIIICAAVFLFSAYKLGAYLLENHQASDSYKSLRTAAGNSRADLTAAEEQAAETAAAAQAEEVGSSVSAAPEGDTVREPLISMDFSALQEVNPEIKGWITCYGTSIDYPVLQAEDNSYYLNHLYDGTRNGNGSIFMDFRNLVIGQDKNTVIYGHHMKNDSMFHALVSYKEQDFYDSNPNMLLYTPEGDYLIELVSGTIEDGYEEFVRFSFEDDADFLAYVNSFRERSCFESSVEVTAEDKLISLCTCTYEKQNARFMVIGKLIPLYVS